jgi:hypothetical protein
MCLCGLQAKSLPHVVSGNLSADIKGELDTRVGTFGYAGVAYHEIKFNNIPTGHRVRILRIQGDTVAWPIGRTAPGSNAGILSGFTTRQYPMGAPALCTLCSADVLTYVQATVTRQGVTRTFKYNYKRGYTIPKGSIWLKQASWLNTFDVPVHIETTYNITFDYMATESLGID